MIFPPSCKYIGNASSKPYGDKVYFLTQYLIHPTPAGPEILKILPGKEGGMMRNIASVETLAPPSEISVWQGDINPHDRVDLIKKAMTTGKRCTIFGSESDHMTFVFEPDLSSFETVHIYDITPPHANLSETLSSLEKLGYFESDQIIFEHHIKNISEITADLYPCRAGGFSQTLDRDRPHTGDTIACCKTGRQICREETDADIHFKETCPLSQVNAEPFIARCCRIEDSGIRRHNGFFGVTVHWASSSRVIAEALAEMLREWHAQQKTTN